MKKKTLLLLIIGFVVSSSTVFAQEKATLGMGNLALKVDYLAFTDSVLDDADVDTGLYLGIEGYARVLPALYLGLEAGYANPDGDDVELTYVPLELNLKYAVPASPNFVVDFGAGASFNYAEFDGGGREDESAILTETFRESGWVFGGQFFVDANYTSSGFFAGINGKYQVTEDFEDSDISLGNWRVGGQIGIIF